MDRLEPNKVCIKVAAIFTLFGLIVSTVFIVLVYVEMIVAVSHSASSMSFCSSGTASSNSAYRCAKQAWILRTAWTNTLGVGISGSVWAGLWLPAPDHGMGALFPSLAQLLPAPPECKNPAVVIRRHRPRYRVTVFYKSSS